VRPVIIIALLTLTGCSSERVQQTGFHQYTVTATGTQAYAKATETCDKQERKWIALEIPPGSPADQFRFECINSYEIVPASQDSYKIRVFVPDMPVKHITIPASNEKPADTQWVLDKEPGDKEATQRATEYCAKMNRTIKITDRTFDMGAGLQIVFKCVQQGAATP
jgi:hypothetical protein